MATRALREHADQTEARASLRMWLRLLRCTNLIESQIRGLLRERFRTTLPRFDVLAQLDAANLELGRGLTLSELCRRLMVTNGNVTGLVERLVSEGLVSRTVSSNDRRSQIVRLTPAGKRAFEKMVPEHRAWVEEMFASLKNAERSQLYDLLGRLKDSVQSARCDERAK